MPHIHFVFAITLYSIKTQIKFFLFFSFGAFNVVNVEYLNKINGFSDSQCGINVAWKWNI